MLTQPRQFLADRGPDSSAIVGLKRLDSHRNRAARVIPRAARGSISGCRLMEFDSNGSLSCEASHEHDHSDAIDSRDSQSSRANSWSNHDSCNSFARRGIFVECQAPHVRANANELTFVYRWRYITAWSEHCSRRTASVPG